MTKNIILCAIFMLAGCAALGSLSGPKREFQAATAAVQEKNFQKAIIAYRKVAADARGSALADDSLYALALIQIRSDNPQRNYAQALRSFEDFLKHAPGDTRAIEVHSWIALLRTVQDLKKENEALLTSIEQLKRVDVRHEERRKGK